MKKHPLLGAEILQIPAIIDSYEAIMNDDRMCRNAMVPLDALSVLNQIGCQNRSLQKNLSSPVSLLCSKDIPH